jgi:hypothetical protein
MGFNSGSKGLMYQIWKGNYKRRMEKPPESQTQHTFCNSIYAFYYSWISFPYKLYTCTKWSCCNRRVFKTVTGTSVKRQISAEAGGTADKYNEI